jgi:hypothetical protein
MTTFLEGYKCPLCGSPYELFPSAGDYNCTSVPDKCSLGGVGLPLDTIKRLTAAFKDAESLTAAQSAHREASESAAQLLSYSEALNEAVGEVMTALCYKGHPLQESWERLCLLSGCYCDPYLSFLRAKRIVCGHGKRAGDGSCQECKRSREANRAFEVAWEAGEINPFNRREPKPEPAPDGFCPYCYEPVKGRHTDECRMYTGKVRDDGRDAVKAGVRATLSLCNTCWSYEGCIRDRPAYGECIGYRPPEEGRQPSTKEDS